MKASNVRLCLYFIIWRIAPCPSILQPSPIMAYKEGWATYAEHPLMSLDSGNIDFQLAIVCEVS